MTLSKTLLLRPSMPFIEAHDHLGQFGGGWDEDPLVPIWQAVGELGRIPYSARFLETRDEYFSYSSDPVPGQGRWMIYGLHLPQDVLQAIYHDNAARLFGLQAADCGRHLNVADDFTHEGTDETP